VSMQGSPFKFLLVVLGAFSLLFFLQFEFYQNKITELELKVSSLSNPIEAPDRQTPIIGKEKPNNQLSQSNKDGVIVSKHEANLLSYGCKRPKAKIAIISQFVLGDIPDLVKQIHRWNHPNFHPCTEKPEKPQIDLIYFLDWPITDKNVAALKPLKDKLASIKHLTDGCFGEIKFLHSGLPDDILSTPKFVSNAHVFFSIYDNLIPLGYEYFFLMEGDTQPIQPNWVQKLTTEVACGQDFWIKGSLNRNVVEYELKSWGHHINGNALYKTCINDEFCYNWTRFILADLYGNAFDYATWWCYYNPKNAPLTRDMMHFYTFSDFIQNQYHKVRWDSNYLREKHPNTYFIHGKNRIEDEGDKWTPPSNNKI